MNDGLLDVSWIVIMIKNMKDRSRNLSFIDARAMSELEIQALYEEGMWVSGIIKKI